VSEYVTLEDFEKLLSAVENLTEKVNAIAERLQMTLEVNNLWDGS
jgi:hypothetical protein